MGLINKWKQARVRRLESLLNKAIDKIQRANKEVIPEPKSFLYDTLDVYSEYSQGVSDNIGDAFLTDSIRKQIASRGTVSRIIAMRLSQLSEFTRPYQKRGSFGYEIVRRDDKPLTRKDKSKIEELTEFLINLGTVKRRPIDDTFTDFVIKIMRDSLTYDKACFEIVRSRLGQPAKIVAVDASTIKRINYKKAQETGKYFVQMINGVIMNEYTDSELVMGIRRPRTDIKMRGYGVPEIDEIVKEITAEFFGFGYNMQFFKQGAAVRGALALMGDIPKNQFDDFVRKFRAYIRGMDNAHTMPVVNIPTAEGGKGDAKFLNFALPNKEMEYGQWIDFQIKCITAAFQMDASEIGHFYGESGNRMFSQDPVKKINASKDRGFKPLLRQLETWLNEYIIWQLNEDYMFRFAGYDDITESERLKLNKERVSVSATINEIREEEGLKPDPYGDIIANPQYIQYRIQKEQAEQMQQQGGGLEESGGYENYGYEGGEETPEQTPEENPPQLPEEQEKSLSVKEKTLKKSRVKVYEVEI